MDSLFKIKNEVLNCKKCSLYKERVKNGFYPVIGEGNHKAKIIFVGEAPGFNEARTSHPFCGAAGKILGQLLKSVAIERKEVYITNILKDRPANNRVPKPEEIKACGPYLDRQIKIIKPKIVCTLGNYSTKYIFKKYGLEDEIQGISKIHGKIFSAFGKDGQFNGVKIIPLYHPAVVVYNQNMKQALEKDFKILEKFK
ncbi:MAG: uracil-DNA glycosylase [Candidatus Nealsonbacteria bacterium CG_4_9_14_3_um_filter_35_11]|uniref:Type-4 uracil-DNA glycosylase n=2 Tax=Candidatus Nealsoniibacteriota TaxID=1817911 RepID=A0A2M7DB75_9BACT|nr:MAG: uracil-DNA glycosylase [Candidatus Nealsonbacteria bacterium CG11_big_fil_rev_8_21_14_0_20_35_11]PIV45725.1 MAG: uracil-DNA glycosylase [Candidatus Nealsonbacteria bacterium CG02_land_8_20_14_3_00_34_20]PIW92767.1 MAG: uracil-DNA glycosylase [Candidatus Nealsonbacteria bacterium CG_4_8_14_3_um_filter_34_13]PIZ90075.1 MAG: uracil-DNA glycosylase [Candidatus Nealsonbacteria bacterium CG_4_10_14_0_2_um_filter_35_20]PJA84800.1 MAG: uracil-DNA glycosylase [Candidatus Nealsonbacteria bacteriu